MSNLRSFLTRHFAEDYLKREAPPAPAGASSGVALFMVIAAVSVLSVLATEFTYVAQVNQKMAFDSLDQLKAHYLAKSGLKLSLLRIKAYAQVKALVSSMSGGGAGANAAMGAIPKQLLEQIWSFPFIFPLPTNLPGMSITDKEAIDDFTKKSGLEGSFTAKISSESAKYNLNRILSTFAAEPSASPGPSSGPSAAPSPTASASPNVAPGPSAGPSAQASFSPDAARKTLNDFLAQILQNKFDTDQDFQSQYRDFRMEDLMDGIVSWADRTYQRRLQPDDTWPAIKQGPFNSVSELHMISPMTDDIFDLFASSLTVSTTPGIDIDTMEDTTLKAIVPQMTPEEVTKFFTYRDSLDEDNLFKTEDDFYKYLLSNVAYFRGQQSMIDSFKNDLGQKGIRLVTEETQFKVTVQAQVQQSVRLLEAWVTLTGPGSGSVNGGGTGGTPTPAGGKTTTPPPPTAAAAQPTGADGQPKGDSGLIVTFMRIL